MFAPHRPAAWSGQRETAPDVTHVVAPSLRDGSGADLGALVDYGDQALDRGF